MKHENFINSALNYTSVVEMHDETYAQARAKGIHRTHSYKPVADLKIERDELRAEIIRDRLIACANGADLGKVTAFWNDHPDLSEPMPLEGRSQGSLSDRDKRVLERRNHELQRFFETVVAWAEQAAKEGV